MKKRSEYSAPACSICSEADVAASEVHIMISPTRRSDYFSVAFGSKILVKSSKQPRCDASRVLHRLGYPDDTILVSHKEGSKAPYSMRGPIGDWRRLRIRVATRDRPRFAKYEPFPRDRVSQGKAKRRRQPEPAAAPLNAPSTPSDAPARTQESPPVSGTDPAERSE
jgi:hypothetical protein